MYATRLSLEFGRRSLTILPSTFTPTIDAPNGIGHVEVIVNESVSGTPPTVGPEVLRGVVVERRQATVGDFDHEGRLAAEVKRGKWVTVP
jgi:hypothetical protein